MSLAIPRHLPSIPKNSTYQHKPNASTSTSQRHTIQRVSQSNPFQNERQWKEAVSRISNDSDKNIEYLLNLAKSQEFRERGWVSQHDIHELEKKLEEYKLQNTTIRKQYIPVEEEYEEEVPETSSGQLRGPIDRTHRHLLGINTLSNETKAPQSNPNTVSSESNKSNSNKTIVNTPQGTPIIYHPRSNEYQIFHGLHRYFTSIYATLLQDEARVKNLSVVMAGPINPDSNCKITNNADDRDGVIVSAAAIERYNSSAKLSIRLGSDSDSAQTSLQNCIVSYDGRRALASNIVAYTQEFSTPVKEIQLNATFPKSSSQMLEVAQFAQQLQEELPSCRISLTLNIQNLVFLTPEVANIVINNPKIGFFLAVYNMNIGKGENLFPYPAAMFYKIPIVMKENGEPDIERLGGPSKIKDYPQIVTVYNESGQLSSYQISSVEALKKRLTTFLDRLNIPYNRVFEAGTQMYEVSMTNEFKHQYGTGIGDIYNLEKYVEADTYQNSCIGRNPIKCVVTPDQLLGIYDYLKGTFPEIEYVAMNIGTSNNAGDFEQLFFGRTPADPTPPDPSNPGSNSGGSSSSKTGASVGGVIGGVFLIGAIVLLYCCCKKSSSRSSSQVEPSPSNFTAAAPAPESAWDKKQRKKLERKAQAWADQENERRHQEWADRESTKPASDLGEPRPPRRVTADDYPGETKCSIM